MIVMTFVYYEKRQFETVSDGFPNIALINYLSVS